MQEAHEKKIRENMTALIDLTSNVDQVLKVLREKDVISEEEQEKILEAESSFDKKSQFFWLMTKKDKEAFGELVDALRKSGNDMAAEKLTSESKAAESQQEEEGGHFDAHVTVDSHPKPDQEGIALAVEIEKEFDRIQSEVDKEVIQEVEVEEASSATPSIDVYEEEEREQEPQVTVEVTAPTESEPEETEEKEEEIHQYENQQNGFKEEEVFEPEIVEIESPPSPKKQVSFVEVTTKPEEPKEFVINDDDKELRALSPDSEAKSIVAMNREKFEKPSANGEGPKVKYSFAKKGSPTVGVAKSEEEPKESTVKNLRNFFQKLGSVETEEAVQKRQGGKAAAGGNANRRTLI